MSSFRFFLEDLVANPLTMAAVIIGMVPVVLGILYLIVSPRLFLLIFKNLGRNRLRTALTCLAIMVLVFMVTMIWTIVFALERYTYEQDTNFKLIISEKWSLPSMMPPKFADYVNPAKSDFILDHKDVGPKDFMSWSFYGGTLEKDQVPGPDTLIFFFVLDPDQIRPMMDDLENFDERLVRKLKENRQAVLVGPERLATLNKKVGERFKVYSMNYKGIDLDVEVVGALPSGRYGQSGIMSKEYFDNALEKYKAEKKQDHPLGKKCLNYLWLRVPDKAAFARVARQIETSPYLKDPEVKCETGASGLSSFMEPYSNLLWFVEYLLVPAILAIIALVIANAISISVRERHQEIAVLKVLGFRPGQVLLLILGESLLVGGLSGLLSAGLTFGLINGVLGGVRFPVAFFPAFPIPIHAFWWGLAIGSGTAFIGSFWPAWSARSVKVAEVFSKVA